MNILPVPIKETAHYRVVHRPLVHEAERVGQLRELWQIAERNKVRLRGWDYPFVSTGDRKQGTDWIASWSDFMGHLEYWRFYQSTQFIYLGSVREMRPDWDQKLRQGFQPLEDAPNDIPGFISIVNFIYTITEFFEYPARLCQAGLYHGELAITIEMHKIRGFALNTDDPRRHWMHLCQASDDSLGKTWQVDSADLMARSSEHALDAMVWFFERFGWLDVSRDALRADQSDFLGGRF